jgi:hydrogenase 3 maturation protease
MSRKIVLGVGNPLGSDDAIGLYVARKLDENAEEIRRQDITVIDAGPAPENYTSVIRQNRPQQLILVDAADMGLPAGSVRLLSTDQIKTASFSTHSMPLSAFVSYVQEFCGQVFIIGVQPEQTAIGEKLSNVVQKSGDRITELILEERLGEIGVLD